MIWGAIWQDGRSDLVVLHKTMNSHSYQQLLSSQIGKLTAKLGDPKKDWLLMEDNAPCHKSRASNEHKQCLGIRTISWPSGSLDLHPIENLWSRGKLDIRKRIVTDGTNAADLQKVCIEAWNSIPIDFINSLIATMPNRVSELLLNEGKMTKY